MRTVQGNPTVSEQDKERGERVLLLGVGWTTYIREEVKGPAPVEN